MAVGLRIRNQGNILQIDGTYQNMELVSSGAVVTSQIDSNEGAFADIAIPAGVANPVIATRANGLGVFVKRQSNQIYRVFSGGNETSTTVWFYIFGEPTQARPSGQVGLIVRNEFTNQIVYNSNKKYMRVMEQINTDVSFALTANAGGSQNSYIYREYNNSRVVAVIQNTRPYQREQNVGGTPQLPISVFSFRSGTTRQTVPYNMVLETRTYSAKTLVGAGGQPSVDGQYSASWTIVDVTGY